MARRAGSPPPAAARSDPLQRASTDIAAPLPGIDARRPQHLCRTGSTPSVRIAMTADATDWKPSHETRSQDHPMPCTAARHLGSVSLGVLVLALISSVSAGEPRLSYPETKKIDHVDEYHGQRSRSVSVAGGRRAEVEGSGRVGRSREQGDERVFSKRSRSARRSASG